MKAAGWHGGIAVDIELDLIQVNAKGSHYLEVRAARAFRAMEAAAKRVGIRLIVNTAWRSMAQQRWLYVRYVAALTAWKAGVGKKPSLVARPGWSTHQSGLSVDINRAHDDKTDDGKANGATDRWLQANAARFGFVNDVASEAWHWTFFGSEEFPA